MTHRDITSIPLPYDQPESDEWVRAGPAPSSYGTYPGAAPRNVPPLLVDCGCESRIHGDGSGVELYPCSLHRTADDLLTACEIALSFVQAEHGFAPLNDGARYVADYLQATLSAARRDS